MMKITHFSNSFIVVETDNLKLCCDPWVGMANYGGWHSFPEYDRSQLISYLQDVDLVYISHLHDDHFDPKFLTDSNLIQKRFIIKNFDIKILYNRLKALGASEITELDEFEIFQSNGANVAIIPQMTSNSSDLEDEVNYDLDTSIIINDGEVTFFNQVDNPLSSSDYTQIKNWISQKFGSLTIAALMAGAASEYPQAFINIDREEAKSRIIDSSLVRLKEKLLILEPDYYFPAGGTYFIPGRLSRLNMYIAQPSQNDIIDYLNENHIPVIPYFLEGGNSISTPSSNNFKVSVLTEVSPISTTIDASIAAHQADSYLHEMEQSDEIPDLADLKQLLDLAYLNWKKEIVKRQVVLSQNISFVVYNNLTLRADCKPDSSGALGTFKLDEHTVYPHGDLIVHIDVRAFYRCLCKKQVWNGTLGSLCLFERTPNIFHPSDSFSINFLTANKEDAELFFRKYN